MDGYINAVFKPQNEISGNFLLSVIFAEECVIVGSLNLPDPELYNEGWRVHVCKYDVSVRLPVHTSNTKRESPSFIRTIGYLCCVVTFTTDNIPNTF